MSSLTVKAKWRSSVHIYIAGDYKYEVLGEAPTVWIRASFLFWENYRVQPSRVKIIRASSSINHHSFFCPSLMGLLIDVIWLKRARYACNM
jgi:hypothetical protein